MSRVSPTLLGCCRGVRDGRPNNKGYGKGDGDGSRIERGWSRRKKAETRGVTATDMTIAGVADLSRRPRRLR